jgi:hypothetical protein
MSEDTNQPSTLPPGVVVALSLVSAAALAYEILLTRLFAIIQWHHFAYMMISVAMLGYGAAGTMVTLFRPQLERRFVPVFAAAAVLALAIGLSVFRSDGSPEQFRAALGPTALLPDATGDATLTKTSSGWRIELDATGLPRLEKGRYYQAWLRNTAGVLVPIGTFNEGRKVTLWAGVSPKDFPTLTVTREQADGAQASSGEKVLVGAVDTGS